MLRMGNFYTNYTLRGPSQEAVAEALVGRSAFVTPAFNGSVVVYDEQSDEQDEDAIIELAGWLSREFRCPVLSVLNHDDDILWYQLFLNGVLTDEYDSCPDYFDPDAEPSPPAGGNAQILCDAFGATNVAAVELVLRTSGLDEAGYTFEVERHEELAELLGLPPFSVGAGYNYIAQGEFPDGLEEEDLLIVR